MSTRFRSLVIGQGTMPVQCADLLVRGGHEVVAVCSPDEALRNWAQGRQIPHLTEIERFSGFDEYEYLFSIVNYAIMPATMLRAPRRLAINYHDGPLPKYAGTYATSWAILNHETAHAITWHVMTEKIDAGDILKQVWIPIKDDDTAYSLNFKCHVTGVRAFAELLQELESGIFTRTPQDLSKRTYFGRSKQPTPDCLIPFDWTADKIGAFFRALDFGPQSNPIGYPKIAIGGDKFAVGCFEACGTRSDAQPGTILEFSDAHARVATGSFDAILRDLRTLDGRVVKPSNLERLH